MKHLKLKYTERVIIMNSSKLCSESAIQEDPLISKTFKYMGKDSSDNLKGIAITRLNFIQTLRFQATTEVLKRKAQDMG